jgi:hypothetical protein
MSRSAILSAGVVMGVVAATSLLLAACSASVTNKPMVVDKDLLSAQVQAQLTKKLGEQAPPISCPDDLAADVGATTTCLMTAPKGTYNVTVTVTDLKWTGFGNFGVGNAIFDTKVADQPNP